MAGVRVDVAQVCRDHGSAVLRRAAFLLGNSADAEDATQEVMLTVLTKGSSFRGEADVATWMYRLTTNVCLNRLRHGRRLATREAGEEVARWHAAMPKEPFEKVAARAQLEAVLKGVDDLSQEIFVYAHLDGLTQEEIAQATGRSRKTVGKRLAELEARFGEGGAA